MVIIYFAGKSGAGRISLRRAQRGERVMREEKRWEAGRVMDYKEEEGDGCWDVGGEEVEESFCSAYMKDPRSKT